MSDGVEVVTAHHERVTLRVGDGYLEVDADDGRLEREVVAAEQTPGYGADVDVEVVRAWWAFRRLASVPDTRPAPSLSGCRRWDGGAR